ncbi:DUF4747 family protein [Aeromonas dhakensis]|uniref:DUF4747 family protein n=1 Tax=Aeromonas dhakensis TaxID=196024 RepID=UPI0039870B71
MARDKKLEYGALNITIHPHTPEKYIQLFIAARKLTSSAKLRGDQFGRIGTIHKLERGQVEPGPIVGEIMKFTNIDIEGEWFNIDSRKIATQNDLSKINIPEHLKPNLSRFSFIFFPKEHILVYEGFYDGKTLTANLAEILFDKVLNHETLSNKFGQVLVSHIPEAGAIDRMLALKGITNLTLVTKRPNPDDLRTTEKRVHDRLKKLNAVQEERILKAVTGNELLLDSELKLEAKVAAKNGIVEIKRYNHDGKKEEFSTKDHPMRRTEFYNPNAESAFEILRDVAFSIRKEITKWIN